MAATMIALGVMGAMSAAGKIQQGRAAAKVGKAQQTVAESDAARLEANAGVATTQAADAIARGADEAGRFGQGLRALIGEQRAGFAAQNVRVGSGSAADVRADTEQIGAIELLTIRNNARREAFGFHAQAQDLRTQADISRRGGAAAAAAGRSARTSAYLGAAESVLGTTASILNTRTGTGRQKKEGP